MSKRSVHYSLPVWLLICCLVPPVGSYLSSEKNSAAERPKRLVIALDGVPYTTIVELRTEGHFKRFHDPARQICTFPSITSPAMVEILHTADSPGYEDHYFDRERNRIVGGIPDRLRGTKFIQGTWRQQFGYHAPAFKGALGYIAQPVGAMVLAELDLSGLKKAFRKSRAPMFIGYVGETDSLAHLGGEWAQKAFLRSLNRTIEDLIAESGGELEVEMFSDHGNHFTSYQRADLNPAIEKAGFIIEKKLSQPRSVVFPRYGLIGTGALFTAPENRATLADICASVEGIDFAAYLESDAAKHSDCQSVVLVSRRGRVRISQMQDRYRYETISGDALELAPFVEELQKNGAMDAAGFASGSDWLRVTLAHKYVDPLRRVMDGMTTHVKYRADVVISTQDGWYVGSAFLDAFAALRATHGNLLRDQSGAFAISTRQQLSSTVRGYEVYELFELGSMLKAEGWAGESEHCDFHQALIASLGQNVRWLNR